MQMYAFPGCFVICILTVFFYLWTEKQEIAFSWNFLKRIPDIAVTKTVLCVR